MAILGLMMFIRVAANVLSIAIIAKVFVSYFLNAFHPVRRTLDAFVDPMLMPIRRVLPNVGMFDFSPLILIILIQVLEAILVRILISMT